MRKLIFLLALFISIISCNKKEEKDLSCGHANPNCIDGYIWWGGDPAADGSGWNLRSGHESNSTYYILKDLSDNFKIDGLAVTACIMQTDEHAICFCGKYYYKITSINRR